MQETQRTTGKRKQPNLNPDTQRVCGKKPVDYWTERDYRDAGHYLQSKSRPYGEQGCRIWIGGKRKGFGRARFRKVSHHAHVLAFFQAHTDIPLQQGMAVSHTCGELLCVNAEHLELTRAPVFKRAKLREQLTQRGEEALRKAEAEQVDPSRFHTLAEWCAMDPAQVEWNMRERL